jgi:hypothetical protein
MTLVGVLTATLCSLFWLSTLLCSQDPETGISDILALPVAQHDFQVSVEQQGHSHAVLYSLSVNRMVHFRNTSVLSSETTAVLQGFRVRDCLKATAPSCIVIFADGSQLAMHKNHLTWMGAVPSHKDQFVRVRCEYPPSQLVAMQCSRVTHTTDLVRISPTEIQSTVMLPFEENGNSKLAAGFQEVTLPSVELHETWLLDDTRSKRTRRLLRERRNRRIRVRLLGVSSAYGCFSLTLIALFTSRRKLWRL